MNEIKIADYYSKEAERYNDLYKGDIISNFEQIQRQKLLLELIKNVGTTKNLKILDIGCGWGRDVEILSTKNNEIYAVDISEGMLRIAKSKKYDGKVHFFKSSAIDLPFENKKFDLIYSSEVIEHIPNWKFLVKESKRCLKEGGVLILTTPNFNSPAGVLKKIINFSEKITPLLKNKLFYNIEKPYDEWKTKKELKMVLEDEGFEIVYIKTRMVSPTFLFYIFRKINGGRLNHPFLKTIFFIFDKYIENKFSKFGTDLGVYAKLNESS